MSKELLDKLVETLINGDDLEAGRLAKEAINKGIPAIDILMKACAPGMMKAGEKFASGLGGASLTDLIMSGESMKAALEVIKPHLKTEKTEYAGKYLLGQIEGDIHTIGRDIVRTMLQSAGWDVTDLGEDVPVDKFIEKAKEVKPDIIGAASAITGSLNKLEELKQKIDGEKLPVKFMVGGWSTSTEWAKSIGAYFARDAVEAVKVAGSLHSGKARAGK